MMEVFRFKDLDRWDRFTIPHLPPSRHVATARIGDLFAYRNEAVDPETHAFDALQPITIHFGGAISRRVVNAGRSYSMALKWVRPGDLVLSKIDLKNGAISVLPDWPNAAVTSHFAVYRPDPTRVSPHYVRLLFQTDAFRKWLWANRSGADGRTEVKLSIFDDLAIPLPPLSEQRNLVAAHGAALGEADAAAAESDRVEAAGVAAFAAALGLETPAPIADRPLFVARFRDLDRWSHEAALRRSTGIDAQPSTWPDVRLGEVIADLENGWSPQCLPRPAEPGEWGVLKLGAITSGVYEDAQNKALPDKLLPRPKQEVRPGDVLIARGSGQTRLVGASSFVHDTKSRLMICDLIFRVVFKRESVIDPKFLNEILGTGELRRQIEDRRTGAAPMMQKTTKPALLALAFPLPPLDVQRNLVAALGDARNAAATLRRTAATRREQARLAFEAAIFD